MLYSDKPSFIMKFKKVFSLIFLFLLITGLSACGVLEKPDWSKKPIVSGKERARQNVKEGKGIELFGGNKNANTNFLFASSNPLWRASLETIDFMSLSNVDYAGGLIITDWYSEDNMNEAVKITITFLSSEIRADGIKIDIRKRNCNQSNQCVVKKIESDLNFQIKDKILKKAAVYKKDLDAINKKNRPKKVFSGDNE